MAPVVPGWQHFHAGGACPASPTIVSLPPPPPAPTYLTASWCQPPRISTTMANFSGMTTNGGSAHHSNCLTWVDHIHVQRCILATHPVWKQHISRAAVLQKDEESDLPHRPKTGCHCSVSEVVSEVVVAGNAFKCTPYLSRCTWHGCTPCH